MISRAQQIWFFHLPDLDFQILHLSKQTIYDLEENFVIIHKSKLQFYLPRLLPYPILY